MTTRPLTGEQLAEMLDAFGHAWYRWERSSGNVEMWELGRARDEAERAIVGAYAELRTELAEARESRDRARTAWDKAREYNNKALEKFAAYERELADANTMIGSLGSQLAAVKAERDRLRERAARLVKALSGIAEVAYAVNDLRKTPSTRREAALAVQSDALLALREDRGALSDDVPDEPTKAVGGVVLPGRRIYLVDENGREDLVRAVRDDG